MDDIGTLERARQIWKAKKDNAHLAPECKRIFATPVKDIQDEGL